MSTAPQNPTQNNQSPIPISSPASIIPNRNPTPNPPSHALKSPSFDEVSNLFSLPLSYAADSLGVCPTVLKKLCYDNGLVRWPYRKILSGKSIEEIKKDAAIEKEKNLAELKVYGERNNSLARSAALSPSGPQPQSTNTISPQESSTVRILPQQPNKDNQIQSSQIMKIGNSTISDEFKYGFPSDGLSSVSYRWWGNKSGGENVVDTLQRVDENADERKEQHEGKVDHAANLSSMDDEVMTQGKKNDEPVGLLSVLRKKAAKDGLQALKLGVYRGYSDGKNLDRTKKMMLVQIFKSSLPSEWGDMYSES
ncbi:hypothetical protein ABFS82_13G047600 [Erythranthe guttata]|uniref:RWP-RK domain-containing protein n=1 Tax=Erythranthe guttata TaxID=4155 RepID=A0A022QUT4_ERYGU|nr:PREDICTED: uncharacterized protein LOC105965898 isoform X1 [Erythranthe guttata]EYU30285.1 hypothetical protein MIMGU_mgv1a010586mg [Erythranthe guttata]|eukprot:XP_012845898.1 PREDICTED: uncharacterized protein LOC105965898 isoform X1 [Erythranthe guttata]